MSLSWLIWHDIYLSIYLSICLSIYLCLSVCLSIYLSILCSPFLNLGRFFSFIILHTVGRAPWTGDEPIARPLFTHRTTQIQNKRTHIYVLSGIRTHDLSVRASEDSSCLRPRTHCDRPMIYVPNLIKIGSGIQMSTEGIHRHRIKTNLFVATKITKKKKNF
jgi:hypothetical protein